MNKSLITVIVAVIVLGAITPAFAEDPVISIIHVDSWKPFEVVVDSKNRVIVLDVSNNIIKMYDFEGNYLDEIVDKLHATSIAVDSADRIIVTDNINHQVKIYDSDGSYLVTIEDKHLRNPTIVAVDSTDRIIVANNPFGSDSNGFISIFESDGTFVKSFFGIATHGFGIISDIAVYPDTDDIIVLDWDSKEASIFDSNGNNISVIKNIEGIDFHDMKGVTADNGMIFIVGIDNIHSFAFDGEKFVFSHTFENDIFGHLVDIDALDQKLIVTDVINDQVVILSDPDCEGFFASDIERPNLVCSFEQEITIPATPNSIKSATSVGLYGQPLNVAVDNTAKKIIATSSTFETSVPKSAFQVFDFSGYTEQDINLLGYVPSDIATHSYGDVLITNTVNKTIHHYSHYGYQNAVFSPNDGQTDFVYTPNSIAMDSKDRTIIIDTDEKKVLIYDFGKSSLKIISEFNGRYFDKPASVSIGCNDEIFVVDSGSKSIIVFDSEGKYLKSIDGPSQDNGNFESPSSVAVRRSDCSVFVADTGNNQIEIFDKSLQYIKPVIYPDFYKNISPVDIVFANNTLVVADTIGNRILFFAFNAR